MGVWISYKQFAFAGAAKNVMVAYASLREKHKEKANKLFYAARSIRDKDKREAKYREIVEKYYASKWYEMVKGWIDE